MKQKAPWLAAALILVVIFGTIWAVSLQIQRNAANEPQLELAEVAAAALDHGLSPAIVSAGRVDVKTNLAPFVIVYDKSGKVVSGSGYLNGQVPAPPIGVLKASQNKDYSWVSWQPESDVRIAAVTVTADKYYVLGGRSLKQVEKNESETMQMSLLGGGLSWLVLGAAYYLRRSVK